MIMALNPALLWQTADTLESWTPAVQAYDEGLGSSVTVTQAMANQLVTVFEGVRDEASPPLADRIQSELDVLDPNSFVGLTMDEAMVQIGERIQGQIFLPLIVKP
jgi:hypothetical protein